MCMYIYSTGGGGEVYTLYIEGCCVGQFSVYVGGDSVCVYQIWT